MNKSEFQCTICKKFYATQQSLCNHTRNLHNITPKLKPVKSKSQIAILKPQELNQTSCNITTGFNNKEYKCKYCDNTYKYKQSRTKHMKICDNKIKITSFETLQQKINDLEKEMHQLKSNNQTINNTTNSTNNGTVNNGTVNNGTINNIIIKYGDEDLSKVLSTDDMVKICNKKFSSIEQSIEMVHLNKMKPELQNIMINNLNNGIAYTYDGDTFIAQDRNTVIEDLIEAHLDNIEMIINQENDNNIRNKLDQNTIIKLEELRERLDDEEKFKINNKTYDNYKSYKINQIKLLIYNCIKKLKTVMKV